MGNRQDAQRNQISLGLSGHQAHMCAHIDIHTCIHISITFTCVNKMKNHF